MKWQPLRRILERLGAFAVAGGVCLAAAPFAQAADLGGACCAVLEERIAELEETAARRGQRRMSLIVSGQVGRSILFWDDGGERNTYAVDGPSAARFRFEGSADINAKLTTGYLLELSGATAPFGQVDQESASIRNGLDIVASLWFVQHKDLGAVTIGLAQTATGSTLYTNLGGQDVAANADVMATGGNFATRTRGRLGSDGLNFSTGSDNISLRWRRLAPDIGSSDRPTVRYDSPILFGGFVAAAAIAEDFWDVNLRYANMFGGFAVAAQAGFSEDTSETSRTFGWPPDGDSDGTGAPEEGKTIVREFQASASVFHATSGLFVSAAYQRRMFSGSDPGTLNAVCGNNADAFNLRSLGVQCTNRPAFDYLWGSAGIRRKFSDVGSTTLYGEYATGWDGVGGLAVGVVSANGGDIDFVTKSRVEVFGAGIVQTIDAAAMELFISYRHYRADVEGLEGSGRAVKADLEPFNIVVTGARIRF